MLLLLGVALALAGHIGARASERRAREAYRELVGEEPNLPEDGWQQIRHLAGHWGCLVAVLGFLRGLGVALALGTGLYLAIG
jgi:hypothetical protein